MSIRWKSIGIKLIVVFVMLPAFSFLADMRAEACMPSSERNILYGSIPDDTDAPVVVEVTINDLSEMRDPSTGAHLAVMSAIVDRVIKGSIGTGSLTIVTRISDCTRVGPGVGLVLGALRHDEQRGLELVAVQNADMRDWSEEFTHKQTKFLSITRGGK
ncbi:hypothetical protein [Bradyrhizobium sp. USDA 4353]